jgi:hypothetical protein
MDNILFVCRKTQQNKKGKDYDMISFNMEGEKWLYIIISFLQNNTSFFQNNTSFFQNFISQFSCKAM